MAERGYFDFLHDARADRRVHVDRLLLLSELWQFADELVQPFFGQLGFAQRSQVNSRATVCTEPAELLVRSLISRHLVLHLRRDRRERFAAVGTPELLVSRVQVERLLVTCGRVADTDAVEVQVEELVDERLVRPRMHEHRRQVDVAVGDDQHYGGDEKENRWR